MLPLFVADDADPRDALRRGGGAARVPRRGARRSRPVAPRARGAALVVRRGDVVAETVRAAREVGAEAVFCTADVSPYARERERLLAAEVDLRLADGHFVVPAGEVAPASSTHYQVFTPYHRAWSAADWGRPTPAPEAIRLPDGVEPGPAARDAVSQGHVGARRRDGRGRAGPPVARRRTRRATAARAHDLPALDGDVAALPVPPPRLPLGPLELALARAQRGGDAVHAPALLARLLRAAPRRRSPRRRARTAPARRPLGRRRRPRRPGRRAAPATRSSTRGCASSPRRAGCTTGPGSSTASFLVKHLGIDWREGARALLRPARRRRRGAERRQLAVGRRHGRRHAAEPHVQPDGAGCGSSIPDGAYVRRYVPELDGVAGGAARPSRACSRRGYPAPIVDHAEAVAAFRERRDGGTAGRP